MENIRLLIVEDHTIVRAALRTMLTEVPGFEVIGEADNGKDAIQHAATLKPNVILMDLSMPNMNGTEAISAIKRRDPSVKIVVLTLHQAEDFVHMALSAGADAYVLKDDHQETLLSAIRSVRAGKSFLSPGVCNNVVSGYLNRTNKPKFTSSLEALTQREREIIKLVAEGYKNREIAEFLVISTKTVEKHRSNLMKKLDLHSASALTTYAIEHGLTGSRDPAQESPQE